MTRLYIIFCWTLGIVGIFLTTRYATLWSRFQEEYDHKADVAVQCFYATNGYNDGRLSPNDAHWCLYLTVGGYTIPERIKE